MKNIRGVFRRSERLILVTHRIKTTFGTLPKTQKRLLKEMKKQTRGAVRMGSVVMFRISVMAVKSKSITDMAGNAQHWNKKTVEEMTCGCKNKIRESFTKLRG